MLDLSAVAEAMEDHSVYSIDRDVEKMAKDNGCTVVYPLPNEIQLDIDSNEAFVTFKRNLKILERTFTFCDFISTPSKSGNGAVHISLKPAAEREFTDVERILLQAILGSDIKREILNTARYLKNGKSNTCLFEKLQETKGE